MTLRKLFASCFQSIFKNQSKKSTIPSNKLCPSPHPQDQINDNHVHNQQDQNQKNSPQSSSSCKISISDKLSTTSQSCTSTSNTTSSPSTTATLTSDSFVGNLTSPTKLSGDTGAEPVPRCGHQKKSISWSHFKQVFPIYSVTPDCKSRTYPLDKKTPYNVQVAKANEIGKKRKKPQTQWTISRAKLSNYYSGIWKQNQETVDYHSSPPNSARLIEKSKLQEKDINTEIEKMYSTNSAERKNSWVPGDRIYFYDTKEIGEILERGLCGPRSNLVLKVRYLNQDFTPRRISVMSLLHAMSYGDLIMDTELMDTYASKLNPALSWTRL